MPAPLNDEQKRQLAALFEQIPEGQKQRLRGNEGKKSVGGGAFDTVFDVLSRPSRASAGAALTFLGKNPATSNPLEAVKQGLLGKTDATYSDVLGAAGVENKWVKTLGGFGLDVALDPLSWTGLGAARGIDDVNATSKAVKAISEEAHLNPLNFADDTGKLFGDAVTAKIDELKAADPAHMYVRVGRKTKIPIPGTEPVMEAFNRAATVTTGVGENKKRLLANRLLNPEAERPFGLNDSWRAFDSEAHGGFANAQQGLEQTLGGLHPEDRRRIALGSSRDEDLVGPIQGKPASTKDGRELNDIGQFQKIYDEVRRDIHNQRIELGIIPADTPFDRTTAPTLFQRGMYPQQYPGLPAGTVEGKYATRFNPDKEFAQFNLAAAEEAGLAPITDALDILKLTTARHYSDVGRWKWVRDALDQFGVDVNKENYAHLTNMTKEGIKWGKADKFIQHPAGRLEEFGNRYIPEDIAHIINQTERTFSSGTAAADLMRWYDKITNHWKFFNTGLSPGFHIRNSMTDAIMNYFDGVRDPKHYDQALRVLGDVKENNLSNMVDMAQGLSGNILKNTAKKTVRVGDKVIPTSQVWDLYLRSGSKSGQILSDVGAQIDPTAREHIGDYLNTAKDLGANTLGGAKNKIMQWGNNREDFFRMAHFLKGLEEHVGAGKTLEEATFLAGKSVRKYNVDYANLTDFEKKVARRIIPFYTWMRKSIPLQVQMLFTHPGFMASYAKGRDVMQGVLGADDGAGDNLIPEWIRNSLPVRLAVGGQESKNNVQKLIRTLAGAGPTDAVFAPLIGTTTPLGELEKIGGPINTAMDQGIGAGARDLARQGLNMINPIAKAPIEAGTQTNLFTGQKINDWGGWLSNQVAPARLADAGLSGGDPQKFGTTLSSWLGGFKPQAVTDPRQAAEFKRRENEIDKNVTANRVAAVEAMGMDPSDPRVAARMQNLNLPENMAQQRWASLMHKHFFGKEASLYNWQQQQEIPSGPAAYNWYKDVVDRIRSIGA